VLQFFFFAIVGIGQRQAFFCQNYLHGFQYCGGPRK
jgi:hypothetical protein